MSKFNICNYCHGQCPDNCECCIYTFCVTDADFALTSFNFHRLSFEDFHDWFVKRFRLE